MITAFLDTNILVSGFVSFKHPDRPPAQILHAWRAGLFELVISKDILTELERTFQDTYFQKRLTKQDTEDALAFLNEQATIIPRAIPVSGITTHPEDNLILGTALAAKVDYFVTGDKSLLDKVGSFYQGVNLVTPNDFSNILKEKEDLTSILKVQ